MSTIGPTIVIGLDPNVGLVSLNLSLVSLYFGHGIVICGTWGRGAGYKVSAAQGGAAGRQASGDKVSLLLYEEEEEEEEPVFRWRWTYTKMMGMRKPFYEE